MEERGKKRKKRKEEKTEREHEVHINKLRTYISPFSIYELN